MAVTRAAPPPTRPGSVGRVVAASLAALVALALLAAGLALREGGG